MTKYLVAIDAGHGMYTQGKQSCKMSKDLYIDGKLVKKKGEVIKENEWNRGIATYIAKALKRCGIDYLYTSDMTGKTDVALSTRAKKANDAKCDILVSCHYNAIGSCAAWQSKAHGLLVLRTKDCSNNSIKLGELITKQLEQDIKYSYSYGLKKDVDVSGFTLAILRQTNMPAVLIEYGFMDFEQEALLMLDTSYQKKCAEATCAAICKYFNVTYRKEPALVVTTPTKDDTKPSTSKSFTVKVTTDVLNIRKGPAMSFDIVGKVKKGDVYTIIEQKNGFGRLKSGQGWISLDSKLVNKL